MFRRIDARIAVDLVPFGPPPECSSAASLVRSEREWQVRNYSDEQLRRLVPKAFGQATKPKPAKTAFQFFDEEKRPTLDNDALYAEARRDPNRPKLSTMQKRALEELWEFSTTDEKDPFVKLAKTDEKRVLDELKLYNGKLAELQRQAGQAELQQWLIELGPAYERYLEGLISVGFYSIGVMLDSLKAGRWGFCGKVLALLEAMLFF